MAKDRKATIELIVILNNLRSSHNVGSIFRTAEAAGVSKIYLVGTTPRPIDRYGRTDKRLAKVSLGAEKYLPWEYRQSIAPLLARLRKDNCKIAAIEQDDRALDYRKFKPDARTALMFGNEVGGILKQVLDKCDSVIEIPLIGRKESLNVAVAAGIILFGLR
jgi:tRNA G18 (ribose-2'-O)-methylase SpoU